MKRGLTKILFATFAVLASSSVLNAEESTTEQGNTIINSRPLSPKAMKRLEEVRQQLSDDAQSEEAQLAGLIIPIKTHNLTFLTENDFCSTASSVSPHMYHWIDSFPQSNLLKFEDGSEWTFDMESSHIVRTWRPGDTLVLSPKEFSFFGSNYNYVLTNKDLGVSVEVNPFLGPIQYGPLTSWVVGLDQNLKQVYIINGQGERTIWEISSHDEDAFAEWAVNDSIIIGENTSWLWWFSTYNNILVNVEMNHYVHAKQISGISYTPRILPLGAPESQEAFGG